MEDAGTMLGISTERSPEHRGSSSAFGDRLKLVGAMFPPSPKEENFSSEVYTDS